MSLRIVTVLTVLKSSVSSYNFQGNEQNELSEGKHLGKNLPLTAKFNETPRLVSGEMEEVKVKALIPALQRYAACG